ncbi:MarR family transcriptional regulator [Altererythrobacter sp. B11]|uniref:MarR family winged helix-turn-helix transcriptional regulator n=1 Tax=Altererythrobacter sp. B11 TaxID=2060312 RepID=UPI000DC6D456|nr:MarR family transcriptional regulator [Altererythrobacter sp. B11]BBC72221.1 MarR family transcriptional regulator [Altererythrobacter sp. B11]
MRDPLPQLPGYALRRAAIATAAELADRLAKLGLRQSDASCLILIGENPGITASAVGRQLAIQRANMVPLLKRIEDAGLVARTPIDGKSQGLELTGDGQRRLAEARQVIDRYEAELLERVPAEHRPHLLPALRALWS